MNHTLVFWFFSFIFAASKEKVTYHSYGKLLGARESIRNYDNVLTTLLKYKEIYGNFIERLSDALTKNLIDSIA